MRSKASEQDSAMLYCYTIGWSETDQAYIARVAEFPSLAAHGRTQVIALRQIRLVVAAVLEELHRSGEPIPEPYGKRSFSGQFRIRIPPDRHRELVIEAATQHVSLNTLVNLKLEAS